MFPVLADLSLVAVIALAVVESRIIMVLSNLSTTKAGKVFAAFVVYFRLIS